MKKKEEKEVNQEVNRKRIGLLALFDEISKGLNPSKVCKKYGQKKQYVNKHIAVLKRLKAIRKLDYGVWEINPDFDKKILEQRSKLRSKPFSSIGLRTNLHALQISFPILEGKIDDSAWLVKNKLNNWIPKYTELKWFKGLTIRNNNNKSITVFAHTRDLNDLEEIDKLAYQIKKYVPRFFLLKYKVILDDDSCKTSNLNIATQDKHSEGMIRKGERFELDLVKKSEKIFPKDDLDGKAWLDGSPFKFSAETNDKEWKREYLRMPFSIRDLVALNFQFNQNLDRYNQNIELHLETLKNINEAIVELKKNVKKNHNI